MSVETDYCRIDPIRSVSEMLAEVKSLFDPKPVILYALAHSRHQFTWSWIAKQLGVPESEWPPQPVQS